MCATTDSIRLPCPQRTPLVKLKVNVLLPIVDGLKLRRPLSMEAWVKLVGFAVPDALSSPLEGSAVV